MKLLGVFSGGLWIIPLLLLGASAYSFYQAVRQRNSGMRGRVVNPQTGQWEWKESKEKLKFTEIGAFWYGVGFGVGAIVSVIMMISDK